MKFKSISLSKNLRDVVYAYNKLSLVRRNNTPPPKIRTTTIMKTDFNAPQNTLSGLSLEIQKTFQVLKKSLSMLVPGDDANSNKFLKNLEDLLLLIFQIYSLKSTRDRILAVVAFMKYRSTKALSPFVMTRITSLITDFESELNRKMDIKLSGLSVQAGEPKQPKHQMRDLLDDWDRLDESPMATKIRSLIAYCMAFSLLEQCGLTENFAEMIYAEFNIEKKRTKKVSGFLYAILDVVDFVLSKAKVCYETGSLQPMFHTSTTYTNWFDNCIKVRMWSKMLDNPPDNGFTEHEYIHDLEEVIEKGTNMQNLAKTAADRRAIGNIVAEMKILRSDHLTVKRASQMRKTPFALLLFGDTGIGKTYLTKMLFDFFGKCRKLPTDDEYMYIRNPNDEFMSGFTSQVLYVLLDDIGYLHPDVASNGDPSVMEMLQMINPAPFTTNQAQLEKKGKVPFLPECIIANTNTRTMNVDKYFSHPSAVQRRLPYIIEPIVKEEFRKAGSTMLDSSKIPSQKEGEYSDLWNFTVHEVQPREVKRPGKERILLGSEHPIMIEGDAKSFFQWYSKVIDKHYKNQDRMMESSVAMKQVSICVHGVPTYMCSETHIQRGEIICDHCNKSYCLWKNYHEACGQICINCSTCMSEEDVMEGSCTYCMVNLQPQAGEMITIKSYFKYKMEEASILMLCCYFFLYNLFSQGVFINHFSEFKRNYNQFKMLTNTATTISQLRDMYAEIGERAEKFLGNRPMMKILSAFGAIVAITKLFVKMNMSMQGGIISRAEDGEKPVESAKEGINPWKNDSYQLSIIDTNHLTKSYKALDIDQLVEICSKNLAAIRVKQNGQYVPNNMFCICDRYYLINNHCIPKEDFLMDISFQELRDGVTLNLKNVAIGLNQITVISGDISIIFIPQLPPKKDLRGLVASKSFDAKCNGYYIFRDNSGLLEPLRTVLNVKKQMIDIPSLGINESYMGKTEKPTEKGYCGAILILESFHGPVLAGIHYVGSSNGTVGSLTINKETIDSFFIDKIIVDTGKINLTCSLNNFELIDLNPRSPVLFVEHGTAQCFGSLTGFRSSPKSLVQPTIMAPYWHLCRNIPITHGQPMMKGYLPWRNALIPMVEGQFQLSYSRVVAVSKAYIDDIVKNLPISEGKLLQIYDLETALNGCDTIQYVDKINFNTSAGFPFNKTKKTVVIQRLDKNGKATGKVDINDEIQKQYEDILQTYDAGTRYNPIFSASLKDEARKLEKILSGETRVFSGCPFAFTLVTRKYCLSFIRVVQRNRLDFECAVGTNTHSTDWEKITQFLQWFGDDLFDGDYKGYDKSMLAMLIYEAALIPMKLMMRYTPVSKQHQQHYHCLACDLAYSFINFNGDLFSFLRNNPSGHALTVIINCIVNSFYFRLAYSNLNPKQDGCKSFQDHVKLVTYGDDFVAGVNSELAPWFNFSSMKDQMRNIGVILTRADKKDGEFTYKSLIDVDFLKRRFVFSTLLNRHIAPLEISSIEKSLVIGVQSKSISNQLQCIAIMSSGLREMFFHGQIKFDLFRGQIMNCISEHNLVEFVSDNDYPTFVQLLDYYRSGDVNKVSKSVEEFNYDVSSLVLQSGIILSDKKPNFIPGHVSMSEDSCTLQIIEYFLLRKRIGIYQYPNSVTRVKFGHYQGDGIRNGQICMVEFINQNVYAESSYCSNHNSLFCDIIREHGLSVHFYMCKPQNFFLEMGSVEARNEERMWMRNHWHSPTLINPITNSTNLYNDPCGSSNGIEAFSSIETAVDSAELENFYQTPPPSNQNRSEESDEEMDNFYNNLRNLLDQDEDLELQSGNVSSDVNSGNQVILEYVDENAGSSMDFNPIKDNTFYEGFSAEAGISKFLERPVLISSQTWDENTDISYTVYPWHAYFNDDVIKRKITNYSLLSCNLHIKIMINASPFYYGLAYASYIPLPPFVDQRTIIDVPGSRNGQVPFSQRPHVCLYPQCSQGGEMNLPFMYFKNWLRVNNSQEFIDMGHLDVRSFTLLQNANSVSSGGATIQIYAWATDVCVAAPSLSLALQAGDEYEECDGAISGPSSAIARAGNILSTVPIIGPYAMATGFIASKIASVAKYFGFTNVPNLSDVNPIKNVPFHGLASTEISTPIEKLSFDAKNELSIDPRIVGLPPKDELSISNFVGKESWIYTASWEATDNVDTILFTSRVVPELIRQTGLVYRYATPMALLNRYFEYWRGDVYFRFRVICTKFHRGRLRFTYDPDGDTVTNSVTSTTSFTKIIDIAQESDFQIRVPYMQALAFLRTASGLNSFIENMTTGAVPVLRDPTRDNGQISLRVFTQQTSPVASAPIQIVVSCWGADNMEFAAPGEGPQDYSSFEIQSGELQYDSPTEMEIQTDRKDSKLNLVHHGEHIVSLRQLMRRSTFYMSVPLAAPISPAQTICYNTFRFPRIPLDYGYDPNGSFLLPGLVNPLPLVKANIVKQSLMSNIVKCFVAHRGSMVYHMNVDSPAELSTIEVARAIGAYSTVLPDLQAVTLASLPSVRASYARVLKASGFQGRTLTNQHTQTGISVHFPMYSNYRFLATRPGNNSASIKVDDSYQDTFDVQVVTKPIVNINGEGSSELNLYYMIGTDFSLHFFLNVPTQVRYNLPVA